MFCKWSKFLLTVSALPQWSILVFLPAASSPPGFLLLLSSVPYCSSTTVVVCTSKAKSSFDA